MKESTAFRALSNYRLAASKAAKPFIVRQVNKDGSVSKAFPQVWDYASTQAEADQIVATRMALNPGTNYVVGSNAS